MVSERNLKDFEEELTDADWDILDRIGKGPEIKIEKHKFTSDSETELEDWSDIVDALDMVTETYSED